MSQKHAITICRYSKRQWFVLTAWKLETDMRIKRNIQRVCAYDGLKFHFGQNDRYEIHDGSIFISPQFTWTQVKSWLNTEVIFSTEMKSHTGVNSFRLSCERTHSNITRVQGPTCPFLRYVAFSPSDHYEACLLAVPQKIIWQKLIMAARLQNHVFTNLLKSLWWPWFIPMGKFLTF